MKNTIIQAKIDIQQITQEATRVIAHATEEAARVVAIAASEAIKIVNTKNIAGINDHDILIELKTRMEDLKKAVQEIISRNELHITKVEFLEHLKADADHEIRIRYLEKKSNQILTWGSAILLILTIINFLAAIYYHLK
jgi:hypothetical protein